MPERYHLTIRELPDSDRPRERLVSSGAAALSPAELLAILLRTGTRELSALDLARELLHKHNGLHGVAGVTLEQLQETPGIGPVKAVEILAAVEFSRRLARVAAEDPYYIKEPCDAASYLMPDMCDLQQEHFVALLLDTKNKVIKKTTITIGLLDSSQVGPRELFRVAVTANAAAVIVAHNHPSGDPTPSRDDIAVTLRLAQAGENLGIPLLDHLVIGRDQFVSMKSKGCF